MRIPLDSLVADLAQASGKLDVNRRQAWIDALTAVWCFLDKLNRYNQQHLQAPFATLAEALQALDFGAIDPALRPTKRGKGGRVPDVWGRAKVRPFAAAYMHFLLEAGKGKADAGKAIARVLDQNGFPLGQRGNTSIEQAGRTVEKWRERLEEGSDQPTIVELYREIKAKYRYPAGTPVDSIEAELRIILPLALVGRIKTKSD